MLPSFSGREVGTPPFLADLFQLLHDAGEELKVVWGKKSADVLIHETEVGGKFQIGHLPRTASYSASPGKGEWAPSREPLPTNFILS